MASVQLWPAVQAERAALAADLENLSDEQWETPSLCAGWSVRDTVAHMTAAAKVSPGRYVAKMALAGFSLSRMQKRDIAIERGKTPADTLARFKAISESSRHPPGPADTWLGEAVIHSEDIRRPLGISRAYPLDAVVQVANLYKDSDLVIGAKSRIKGVRLRGTDSGWSHGSGPEVAGPTRSLLMVMAGRTVFLDDLAGDGVAILRQRS